MYLVPTEEYEQLKSDQKKLQALESNGVDNWIGYEDSMKIAEEEEEDFLTGKTCNPDAPEECESCQ